MRHAFAPSRILLAALLVLAAIAFWPGVHGGFLFDDYPNLSPLGNFGAIDSWSALTRYATSGDADPTGRPIAVLSFLLDARNWPANPYPFKLTNILLHLLNGLLLYAVLAELGRASRLDPKHCARAAVLGAGMWLLHPLFLSTVLYIVQREAMLPATFTFFALWGWLVCRRKVLDGSDRFIACLPPLVVGCTALAVLSKANGLLLPSLLLVVECRLARLQDTRSLRNTRRILLWLPTVLLAIYVSISLPGFAQATQAIRGWSLGQRLLTEARVLFDYLGQLWLPRPISPGLFNDGYVVSTDLLHPWTTLPAVIGLLALGGFAWRWRARMPTASMAIAFYLVGQSIESGPFPLELYFEHRNYLPAALMFWPLALMLTRTEGQAPRIRHAAAFGLPLLLAGLTWIGAGIWGDPAQQARVWGDRNPDSPRAQAYQAQFESAQGLLRQAEARLRMALHKYPNDVQLHVNLIGLRCQIGAVAQQDISATVHAFAAAPDPTRLAFRWMQRALPIATSGSCHGLGLPQVQAMAQAFADNPATPATAGRKSDSLHMFGEVALASGRPEEAFSDFNAAYVAEPKLDTVLLQAAMLASAHQPQLALAHLQRASVDPAKPWYQWRSMGDIHNWVMYRQHFWQQQIDELRGKIQDDLKHAS